MPEQNIKDVIVEKIKTDPVWLERGIRAIAERIQAPDSLDFQSRGIKRVGKYGFDGFDASFFKYVLKYLDEDSTHTITGGYVKLSQKRLLKYVDQLVDITIENLKKEKQETSN